MKANLPPSPEPNQAFAVPSAALTPLTAGARSRWKRRLAGAITLLLLVVVAGGVWWWMREKPLEPPMPTGITDTEVREALEKNRAIVLADPRSAEAWGSYGTVLLAHLFDREADRCFAEAARLNPKDPRWPYARGQIALKRDPPNALVLLATAAEAASNRPEYRTPFTLALAEALLEAGQTDRAAELFQKELALAPDDERGLYGMGLVALVRGDDATAARNFEAVRKTPSCRKQANAHLAALARARGDVPAAKQYEAEAAALEADPPWPDPYLDHVITLQVGIRGLQRRVAMLERDGDFAGAVDAFLAQARQKRTSYALTGAGVNLARLKRYDEALVLLREAVQLDPADPNAHYTLALVLFTHAEKEWARDPSSSFAANAFREVVTEGRRATELKPDHALAYMFWGLALKNLGDAKGAIEPLRKALVIRPEQFDVHLGLGQALAAIGDRAAAVMSLKAAQRLKPDDPRPAQELAKLKGG